MVLVFISLDLGDLDDAHFDVSSLQILLEHHSSTLQELTPPVVIDDTVIPTFSLPHLHTLTLYVNDNSALLPPSFSASLWRILAIEMLGEEGAVENMARTLAEAVAQHRATLETVWVQAIAYEIAEERDQEALHSLKALCEKEGIRYDFELAGP